MSSSMKQLFDRAWESSENRLQIKGRLGRKNADGSYSMAVPARKNFFYVTLTMDGSQTIDIARVVGVPRLYNLPVVLRRKRGNLVVTGLDLETAVIDVYLNGGVSFAPPHTHREGSGLEYEIEAKWIDKGRVLWSSGVTVRIRPFLYRYNGTRKYYEGGTLSLSSNLPATASKWAWVIVWLNPSTNAVGATTGTEYSSQVDLLDSLIDDPSIGDNIPLAAVQCQNGDTSLGDIRRYRDARHWLDERFRLDDLTNIDITTPSDGQVLSYDNDTSTWVNATPGASDVAAAIHAADDKATPVDADEFGISDSADSWALKKLTWANLKATVKTYFDTLYATLVHATSHQHGGADEVATATPTANAIPKAGGSGNLNAGWIPDLSATYSVSGHTHSYQPLDAELTAIAGLMSAANKLPYFTGSGTASLADITAFALTLIDDVNAAAARVTLGLVIGTDVQAQDAELAALAGLASAADGLPYFTGSGTAALTTLTSYIRGLLDDEDAATARTTLGLGTMAVETATAYLLLAGRAGGQTANGGTASGDDLTLDSTAHATKGTIWLNPTGGNVGIRRSAVPDHTVHIGDAGSGLQPEFAIESTAGRKFIAKALDSGLFTHFGLETNHNFAVVSNNVERMRFSSTGLLSFCGPGSAFAPQGNFHFHDGTTGFMIHTVSITSGTAVTVIANGTGDVLDNLVYDIIVNPSTGSSVVLSASATPTPTTVTLYDASGGSEHLDMVVNSNGSVTIQRTAGSFTYTVSLKLFWQ